MTCLIGGVAVLLVTMTTWATQTFIVPLVATWLGWDTSRSTSEQLLERLTLLVPPVPKPVTMVFRIWMRGDRRILRALKDSLHGIVSITIIIVLIGTTIAGTVLIVLSVQQESRDLALVLSTTAKHLIQHEAVASWYAFAQSVLQSFVSWCCNSLVGSGIFFTSPFTPFFVGHVGVSLNTILVPVQTSSLEPAVHQSCTLGRLIFLIRWGSRLPAEAEVEEFILTYVDLGAQHARTFAQAQGEKMYGGFL